MQSTAKCRQTCTHPGTVNAVNSKVQANMHTSPEQLMQSTAKCRQTCTHPGTVNAVKTCSAAIHGTQTHLMIADQMQRAS